MGVSDRDDFFFPSMQDHLSFESHNAQVFCLKTDETTHEPQNAQFTPTVGKVIKKLHNKSTKICEICED